jgi:hypothetical protein
MIFDFHADISLISLFFAFAAFFSSASRRAGWPFRQRFQLSAFFFAFSESAIDSD